MHRRQGGGQRAGSGYNGGAQQQRQPQPDDPFASFWGAYGGNPYGNAGYGGYGSAGYGQAQQDDSIEMRAAKNYIDTAIMPRRSTRWAACPPESETLAGIFSARWRRAACIIMRRQWNMRGRPQAWSRATCSISSCSASFRAAAAGTASRTGIWPQNRRHEQRLHDVHAAEPVLRLLRRRKNDVCSAVLLHLKRFECKTSRKAGKSDGFCLYSAMKSAITKARRKGFAGLALCGLARW